MWIPAGMGLWLVGVLVILLRLRRQGPDAANAFAAALKSSARAAFIGLLLVAAFVVLLMNPDPHSTDNGLILLAAPGAVIVLCFFSFGVLLPVRYFRNLRSTHVTPALPNQEVPQWRKDEG